MEGKSSNLYKQWNMERSDSDHILNTVDRQRCIQSNICADNSPNRTTGILNEDYVVKHFHVMEEESLTSTVSSASIDFRRMPSIVNETHPFGLRVWKPAIYKKQRSVEQQLYKDIHETSLKDISVFAQIMNSLWVITFGITTYVFVGLITILLIGMNLMLKNRLLGSYINLYKNLGVYMLYPFGLVLCLNTEISSRLVVVNDTDANYGSTGSSQAKVYERERNKYFYKSKNKLKQAINLGLDYAYYHDDIITWLVTFLNYIILAILISSLSFLAVTLWLSVFTIPIANIIWNLTKLLYYDPLQLRFLKLEEYTSLNLDHTSYVKPKFLFMTLKVAEKYYVKYTYNGINVIFTNLLLLVVLTIFDYYVLYKYFQIISWLTSPVVLFLLCLISIIPLSFYIGQAIVSISSQSSIGVGVVINAFFSSIVEIFLYCIALSHQEGLIVEGAIIGSILGSVLLLPGSAMCSGAVKKKVQKYNPASAGITSILLIFSCMLICIPTVVDIIYGDYGFECEQKILEKSKDSIIENCHLFRHQLEYNKFYRTVIVHTSQLSSLILFSAYVLGLWYTLKTHALIIWSFKDSTLSNETNLSSEQPGSNEISDVLLAPMTNEGDDQNIDQSSNQLEQETSICLPGTVSNGIKNSSEQDLTCNWSITKSITILLAATALYAVISNILIDCLDQVIKKYSDIIHPKLIGLTVIALIPNTTEFVNAIAFALQGNISLSMEIGSAYALQVGLLQIPALILYSTIKMTLLDETASINVRQELFPMVFPIWDIISLLASSFIFTYIFAEGNSNYFKGAILIMSYIILIPGFYLQTFLLK